MTSSSAASKALMPLHDFCNWLEGQGKAGRTVEIYTAHVRSIFHTPAEANMAIANPEEGRATILAGDRGLAPSAQRVFRCALRAFSAYVFEKTGGKVELLPRTAFVELTVAQEIEKHPLTLLLAKVAEDMPLHRLVDLKWKHVKHGGGYGTTVKIFDPATGRTYEPPTETLLQINLWAGGGERVKNPDLPIVPREPLSPFPMPASILRKLACQ